MSPWNAALLRTADSLAALLAEPARTVDLDVAITARAAVLDHVSTVLADVAPRTRTRHARPIGQAVPAAMIEADPLDGLGRILHGRLRPVLDRAPSELLDPSRRVDPLSALWVDVGRNALVATRAWGGSAAPSREGEWTRQIVGELAALAQAVAALDRDLVAQSAERPWVRQVVDSTAGLGIAAREVLALADTGPAARPTAKSNDPAAIKAALAERSGKPPTLSKEVRHLTALLDQAPGLTPQHVRACARVGRGLAVLAARDAVAAGGGDLREQLGALARGLHAVATRDGREFSINPVQARAFELQLRDVHATTKLQLAGGKAPGEEESTRVARRLPDLVEALHRRVCKEIGGDRWAIPDRTPDAQLPYAFASATEPGQVPPMLGPLSDSVAAAADVRTVTAQPLRSSRLGEVLATERHGRTPAAASTATARMAPPHAPGLAR